MKMFLKIWENIKFCIILDFDSEKQNELIFLYCARWRNIQIKIDLTLTWNQFKFDINSFLTQSQTIFDCGRSLWETG